MVKNNKTNKNRKAAAVAGSAVAIAVIGAGGYGIGYSRSDGLRDSSKNYPITQQEYDNLNKTISSLRTRKDDGKIPNYSRDSLPSSWKDLDGNGCNTRYDVLTDNFRKYARYNSETCEINSGSVYDYYNGKVLRYDKSVDSGGGIQIDHIVSIGNAWISGGYEWTDDKWAEYVNDKDVLLPTASSTNQSKGNKDITEWQPANGSFLCAYVARQIEIKDKYNLTVTAEEKNMFKSIIEDCAKR